MRFMYVGEERETTVFGHTFRHGEAVEVTDEHAIKKLSNHHLFVGDEAKAEPKARARKDKADGQDQG